MVEIDEVLEYARKIADLNQWKVALITNHIKRHPLVDINIRNCGPKPPSPHVSRDYWSSAAFCALLSHEESGHPHHNHARLPDVPGKY